LKHYVITINYFLTQNYQNMKKVFLMSAALAAFMFVSCEEAKVPVDNGGTEFTKGVAYVAINIETEGTRADESSESGSTGAEDDLNSLYLITFDESGTIVANPNGIFYNVLTATAAVIEPTPQPIMSNSHYLVVIANPGTELASVITTGLDASSTIATLNAAITASGHVAGIVDNTKGFTMISSDNANLFYPYVAIGDYMEVVTGANPAATAEANAAANRLPVKLERLASKLAVAQGSNMNTTGGSFTFTGWTVDAVNSSYYPYAEKTQMAGNHTPSTGNAYTAAFYTKDPNYVNYNPYAEPTDIVYGDVDNSTFDITLPMTQGWISQGANNAAYVIENTMDAESQLYGNATRIVIKATYFPTGYAAGADWFSFQGTNYASLATLQAAYGDANASNALKTACDLFYTRVKNYPGSAVTAANFAALTTGELLAISPGAEVTKDDAAGSNSMADIIRWYKAGLCYYYYDIRHNSDTALEAMAYTKYGVVRNNWYSLTLNKVNGPGTPWYPELPDPGPGDPKPGDPLDDQAAYLGVSISVNPWVLRNTGFEI
jgi:hypothetical protein